MKREDKVAYSLLVTGGLIGLPLMVYLSNLPEKESGGESPSQTPMELEVDDTEQQEMSTFEDLFVGDEVLLSRIRANPRDYIGEDFVIFGGIRVGSYFNFGYRRASDSHYSIRFIQANRDGSLSNDRADLYLKRWLGEEVVERLLANEEETSAMQHSLARVTATISETRYEEGGWNLFEVLDVQFANQSRSGWEDGMIDASTAMEGKQDGVSAAIEGEQAGEVRVFGEIEMVWCPPGEFLMGSPEGENGRESNERQHTVELTRGFWLAKYECTQAQWESVTGSNPSLFKGPDLPVEQVSWDDVQGWMAKMNELHPLPEDWMWDLPTEAQWEYACRAGSTLAYGGTGNLDEMGWYALNNVDGTNPVGTKAPNAWGLYDMHGNVWEWCRDWYGNYPSSRVVDPTGADSGSGRVFRGGGWIGITRHCRSARRSEVTPDHRGNALGFRPAAVPAAR